MTESSDPQLQLKKRARRRLVGAVAFAGFAAVILPMVMDEEPKQQAQNVEIRIPGQDQLPFKPAELAARVGPTPALPPAAADRPAESTMAGDTAQKVQAPVSASKPTVSRPSEKTADKKVVKPAEKLPEQVPDKKAVKAAEKTPEKPVAKKADKSADKSAEKASEKPAEKATVKKADKPTERMLEKPADKPVEKSADKPVDRPAEKPPLDKPVDEAGKTVTDEAPQAAPVTSKPSAAAPAKASGQQVILIGAFANPDNVKQLQGKIGGLGINSYTELLTSADGTKTRVRAGPFPTREAAEKALEKLKRSGINGVVAGRQ
ncbi:SPOR domain-containing protein [Accumulibacter sp.]|uniref:SPOR domain-containing protein n=1 Tax=Accumulibacter sp. TaxID=2053492 RepID=UPI002609E48E|nr:SPOR domain-containing protein [Accumulibacter sp.]